MKVALFLPSLTIGGVQRIIVNLANGLNQLGCSVMVISCDGKGDMSKKINNACEIVDLKVQKLRGDLKPIFSVSKLKKYLKKEKPDFLIAAPGFSSVTALRVIKKLNSNTSLILIVDNKLSLLLKRKLRNKINYYLLKHYSKSVKASLVTVHQNAYLDAKDIFKDSKFSIYKIYHPLIEGTKEEKIKDKKLNDFLRKNNVIISAGRLVYEKNYMLLLQAFEKLIQEYPNYKLLILGDGILRTELEYYCKTHHLTESVWLYGFSNQVIESMKKSKIYVSSSIEEAFGNCIVEALSTGVRIVSTDVESKGPYEILEGGKFGRLCKNNDVEALYKAIKTEIEEETSTKEKRIKRSLNFTVLCSSQKYYDLMRCIQNEKE